MADLRPAPPPMPTSRPTPEREARAALIEAPMVNGVVRRWWTVHSRLELLLKGKLIDRATYDAAQAFTADAHRVYAARGASILTKIGMGRGSGDAHAAMLGKMQAVARLRAVR